MFVKFYWSKVAEYSDNAGGTECKLVSSAFESADDEECLGTFFTVYGVKPDGTSRAITDTTRQEDAEELAAFFNSLPLLTEACREAFKHLSPKGNVKKDFPGHVAQAALSKAVHHMKRWAL